MKYKGPNDISIKKGDISKQEMFDKLKTLLSSRFGLKDVAINIDLINVKGGNLIPGKNAITIKFVNVPKDKVEEIARVSIDKMNEIMNKTPYKCEANLLIYKPLVPFDKSNEHLKAYLSLNVVNK